MLKHTRKHRHNENLYKGICEPFIIFEESAQLITFCVQGKTVHYFQEGQRRIISLQQVSVIPSTFCSEDQFAGPLRKSPNLRQDTCPQGASARGWAGRTEEELRAVQGAHQGRQCS